MSSSLQFEQVLASLARNPLQRNGSDISTIKAHLKTIPFLNSQFLDDEESFQQLSKVFRLEIFEKGSIIFHIDTRGDKYYLILKGQVEIYARPPKKVQTKAEKLKEKQEKEKAKQKAVQERKTKKSASTTPRSTTSTSLPPLPAIDSKKPDSSNRIINANAVSTFTNQQNQQNAAVTKLHKGKSDSEQSDNEDDEKKKDKTESEPEETEEQKALRGLIMVKLLLEGWAFGEMALLYNQPRLASAVAAQRVTLAVLTKHNFHTIMRKAQMKLIQAELDVLRGSYLFSSWEDAMLREIYLNSEMNYIRCDQNVFKQGDEAESIYIIKKGLFQMNKTITINQRSEVEINAKSISFEGNLSERDVFGEEEFVEQIRSAFNMGFSEADLAPGESSGSGSTVLTKQQESTLAQRLQEEFKSKGKKIERESTVMCKNREGGTVIKIKIYDFLSRVLVFRATRLAALASIEQKRQLHRETHERNTLTISKCHPFFKQIDSHKQKASPLTQEDAFRCTTRTINPSQFVNSYSHRSTANHHSNNHTTSSFPSEVSPTRYNQQQYQPSSYDDHSYCHTNPTITILPATTSTKATVAGTIVHQKNQTTNKQMTIQLKQQQSLIPTKQQPLPLQPLSPMEQWMQNINVEDEDSVVKKFQYNPDSLDYDGGQSARRTHQLKPKPPQPGEKELMTPFKFDTARIERYKISKRKRKKSANDSSLKHLRVFMNEKPRSLSSHSQAYPSPQLTTIPQSGAEATSGNNHLNGKTSHSVHHHLESLIERRIKKMGYSIRNSSPDKRVPFSNKRLISQIESGSNSRVATDSGTRKDIINVSISTSNEEQQNPLKMVRPSTIMNNSLMDKRLSVAVAREVMPFAPFTSQQSTIPTVDPTGILTTEASIAVLSSKPQFEMEYMRKCGFKGHVLRKIPPVEQQDEFFDSISKGKHHSYDFKSIVLQRRKTQESFTNRRRFLSQTSTPEVLNGQQISSLQLVSQSSQQSQSDLAEQQQQFQLLQQLSLHTPDISINPLTNQIMRNIQNSRLKTLSKQPFTQSQFV